MGEGHGPWVEEVVAAAVEHYGARGELTGRPPRAVSEAEVVGSLLRYPGKVAAGGGRLVVSDSGHHRLLVLGLEGEVEAVVGAGVAGWRDGALATAQFRGPQGVCLVGEVVYVADTGNHAIRKVDLAAGTVETVAGTGEQGADMEGGGEGRQQAIASPWDLAAVEVEGGGAGLVVAMAGLHQLWLYCITDLAWWKGARYPAGTMVRVVGSGAEENRNNSYPAKAGLAQPSGLAVTADSIMVADSESSTVRQVSRKDGAVRGLAGGGLDPTDLFAFGDLEGEGRAARLQHPLGVAAAADGETLYLADSYNHKVRQVAVLAPGKGRVSTLAGGLAEPGGLCLGEGGDRLYIADTNNHCVKVLELETGEMTELEVRLPCVGEQEDAVTAGSRQVVGPGEGVVTIRASTTALPGSKLNTLAPSTWSLAVDQVQGGGWQFPATGRLLPDTADGSVVWSVQHPALPAAGAVLSLRLRLFTCDPATGACRAAATLRHSVTLLPGGEGDFAELHIGNLLALR
jgi:sugar lactone lactonase YvrE